VHDVVLRVLAVLTELVLTDLIHQIVEQGLNILVLTEALILEAEQTLVVLVAESAQPTLLVLLHKRVVTYTRVLLQLLQQPVLIQLMLLLLLAELRLVDVMLQLLLADLLLQLVQLQLLMQQVLELLHDLLWVVWTKLVLLAKRNLLPERVLILLLLRRLQHLLSEVTEHRLDGGILLERSTDGIAGAGVNTLKRLLRTTEAKVTWR
jgi:hypothetical protein